MDLITNTDHFPGRALRVVRQHAVDYVRQHAVDYVLLRGKSVAIVAGALAAGLGHTGHAFAQAASPAGGLGAQINTMSSEALNSGSTAFGMACYIAATVCFFFGVWAAWQSRQPQNRETGYVGRAMAGLALCGLFATGGVWINKASITATGANATINTTPSMVQFGTGG